MARLAYVVAALLLAGGILAAFLLPDYYSNPCEVERGQIIPGCMQPVERDNRLPLRLAVGAGGTIAALSILGFSAYRRRAR